MVVRLDHAGFCNVVAKNHCDVSISHSREPENNSLSTIGAIAQITPVWFLLGMRSSVTI